MGRKFIVVSIAAFCAHFGAAIASALSVTEFGAIGDGETDSTAAFQEAIHRAGESGEILQIPAGRYLLSGDLEIGKAVAFAGEGSEVSILTSAGGNGRIFVRMSGTSFRDLGFEEMTEPIALVSRADYVLEDLRFERCRFERIEAVDSNLGTIGLSSGKSSQRAFRIRRVALVDCEFRKIRGSAVNLRADISEVKIVGCRFLDIGKQPDDHPGESAYAIRLGGYVDKTDGIHDKSPNQGRHLIAGNVIRGMRKFSETGNLKGMLLYGDYSVVRDNLIEEIDGGEKGEDTNAMYIRGAYTTVVGNVVRDIRGADDDGAIAFKGEMARGSRWNVIAGNRIERIRGMSAVEVSSSDFLLEGNVIADASARGFYHRSGENATVRKNRFSGSDVLIRSSGGEVRIAENEFVECGVILGQRRSHPSRRDSVMIHDNVFEPAAGELAVWLENDVEERRVTIRDNHFVGRAEDFREDGAGIVDLRTNGIVVRIEFAENRVEPRPQHPEAGESGD